MPEGNNHGGKINVLEIKYFISGLFSAFYLMQKIGPTVKITVFH